MPDVFRWDESQAICDITTGEPVSLPLWYTGLEEADERVAYLLVATAIAIAGGYEIDAAKAVELCVRNYLEVEQLEGQAAARFDWPISIEVLVPQYDDWVSVDVWADFDPKFTIEFPRIGDVL